MALEIIQPEDLDTPRTYSHVIVVGHRREYLPVIEAARIAVFGDHKPTDTLVGVQTLAAPGYLIEVDAVAVVN